MDDLIAAGRTEFSIRVPKESKKTYNIIRFDGDVNLQELLPFRLQRENIVTEMRPGEEMPKFGAGSEYRHEEREEARRRKYGYNARKRNPNNQPWIMKSGKRSSKKLFQGVREGGIGDNSDYYLLKLSKDGTMEAHKVKEWYNFKAIQRYKTLTFEEAEEQFEKRNKTMNYFANKVQKRLRTDEDGQEEDGNKKKGKANFKMSDMDEWLATDESDASNDETDTSDKKKKTAKNKPKANSNAKKKGSDDESPAEESDDGDEEGRECEYISDSSEEISDVEEKVNEEMQGVADETAMRELLTSSDEDETDKEKANGEEGNADKKAEDKKPENGANADGVEETDASGTSQPSSSSQSGGSSHKKCHQANDGSDISLIQADIRRYLSRKPMTPTQLLQKIKSKGNVPKDALYDIVSKCLKRIGVHQSKINGQMYLSLK